MNRPPVCVSCQREIRCIKNGVKVLDVSGHCYLKLTSADEYGCPNCDTEVIIGFAEQGIISDDKRFDDMLEQAKMDGLVRPVIYG